VEVEPSAYSSQINDRMRFTVACLLGILLGVAGSRAQGITLVPWQADPLWSAGFETRVFYNSGFPWSRHSGPVWVGRGHTSVVRPEVQVNTRWGGLRLAPVASYAQNAALPVPVRAGRRADFSLYRYPEATLDLYWRPGTEPVRTLNWGYSEAWLRLGPVYGGVSHAPMWWGPGHWQTILGTDHGPGFPRAFAGVDARIPYVGTVEAQYSLGELRESDYFDFKPNNNRRYWLGLAGVWSPAFLPGLSVGGTRIFVDYWPDRIQDKMGLVFQELLKKRMSTSDKPEGLEAQADQMASLWWRWDFERSGVSVYGEWGKGDHSWDIHDLWLQPSHASGYHLGMRRTRGAHQVTAEWIHLESPQNVLIRGYAPFFHVHGYVEHGYTHRGRLLGSSVGPNGTGVHLAYQHQTERVLWRAYGERITHDRDAYYRSLRTQTPLEAPPIEATLGGNVSLKTGALAWSAQLAYTHLAHADYERGHTRRNVHLGIGLRYTFQNP